MTPPIDGLGLAGATAIVTGGSGTIGGKVARALASHGVRVGVTWFMHEHAAQEAVEAGRQLGVDMVAVRGDLGTAEGATSAVRAVTSELGPPQLLVHCAGAGVVGELRSLRSHQWKRASTVNAESFLWLLQNAPDLTAAVGMTSLGSSRAIPGYGATGVAKAALEAVIRYAAVEMWPGCRVNGLSAGYIPSASANKVAAAVSEAGVTAERRRDRSAITAEDVANVACFLLSPMSCAVTGQVVTVDGGFSLRLSS